MSTYRPLRELVELQRGTTYKSALLDSPGPVLLGLASIARDGGFRDDSLRTYGGESPGKLLLRPGDLYVSLKDVTQSGDLLGAVSRVPNHVSLGRLTQDTVKLTRLPGAVPATYLYWALRTPEYRQYCRSRAIGTTNLSLSREDFLSFPVPEPTRDQVELAELLDAIELKIALTRHTNETLEMLAKTLLQSWFVDFDPTKARPGNLPPVGPPVPPTYPVELVGTTPSGWEQTTLAQACARGGGEVQTGPFGSQLHASDYVADGIPVVMPTNIRQRRISRDGIAHVSPADADRLGRHKLAVGDIVYSRRGDVEKHAIVGPEEQGWLCGTGCLRVRPAAPGRRGVSTHFLSLWLDQPALRSWIAARAVGATMPNLNTGILGEAPVLLPGEDVLDAFDRFVVPLDGRVRNARAEASTLSSLRHLLLPRLLAEIQLRDLSPAEAVA